MSYGWPDATPAVGVWPFPQIRPSLLLVPLCRAADGRVAPEPEAFSEGGGDAIVQVEQDPPHQPARLARQRLDSERLKIVPTVNRLQGKDSPRGAERQTLHIARPLGSADGREVASIQPGDNRNHESKHSAAMSIFRDANAI